MAENDGKRLVMLLGGHRVGMVVEDSRGRLSLTYDDEWRGSRESVPISLSMPLASRTHHDPTVRAFLSGLLPDNSGVFFRSMPPQESYDLIAASVSRRSVVFRISRDRPT